MSETARRKISVPGEQDIVVIDETETCPYLPDRTARMPLRMPIDKITPREADIRFANGTRRTGEFLYQTRCPNCTACEPIRIDCTQFEFSRSHRRVLHRGNRELRQTVSELICTNERVQLFNAHRESRGLAKADSAIDAEEYIWGFVRSCFDSFEMTYRLQERIVGVAVCDRGAQSLSAVYTFWDPGHARLGLGTYSLLKQIEYCQQNSLRYLYLGFFVKGSRPMEYKARFLPHQKLLGDKWVTFDDTR